MVATRLGNVVYTYGVFDLFHIGHLELLREARALGGYLIVGVYTDEVTESFKRKPIIPFKERMEIVRSLFDVNEVVPQTEYLPDNNLREIQPQVLAKGPGAGWDDVVDALPGQGVMNELGGKVVMLAYHGEQSTSAIIEKIKAL